MTKPDEVTGLTPQPAATEQMQTEASRVEPHPTVKERIKQGKSVRKNVPREAHTGWNPPLDRPDPVDLLEAQAASRVPELVPIRYQRMLASPFSFYRGAAVIMASDLATLPNTGLNVQICGDAHLANFGGFASPSRELILDLNDFDETLPGPWEWDLKRLVASIEIACRERGFDAKTRHRLVHGVAREYQQSMHEFAVMNNLAMWYLRMDMAGMQARWGKTVNSNVMKELDADFTPSHIRDNLRAYEKLTHKVGGEIRIAARPPLIVPIEDIDTGAEQEALEQLIRQLIRQYRSTLQPNRRHFLKSYRYVHLARKVVGIGSVGTRTWIILFLGHDDKDPLFLQAKEAQPSVLEPYLGRSVYPNHGQRIVVGQWLMQSASDIFLGWDRTLAGIDGKPHDFYFRQLWDWKISANIELMSPDELLVYGKLCSWTLARAHARSGDRIAIAAYLGKNNAFNHAIVEFASDYADQNERDFQALIAAAKSGRIKTGS